MESREGGEVVLIDLYRMKRKTSNNGLIIGACFAVIVFACSFVFIIPLLAIIPGLAIELLGTGVFPESESHANQLKLFVWTLIFLGLLLLFLRKSRKVTGSGKILSSTNVVVFMASLYFILTPWVSYILWNTTDFMGDRPLLPSIEKMSRYTSILYLFIGALIDAVKKTAP